MCWQPAVCLPIGTAVLLLCKLAHAMLCCAVLHQQVQPECAIQYLLQLPSRIQTQDSQHDALAGDAVVLQRWSDDRFKLHMHIIKDAFDSMVASATTSKGKAKRGTAGMTQRRTKVKPPSTSVPSCRQELKPYSPGSLEALHDAALLCANSPSPDPSTGAARQRQDMAPSLDLADTPGGSVVPAAAVAAADAAALWQQGSPCAVAADMTAEKAVSEQNSGQHKNDAASPMTAADNGSVCEDN